MFTTGARAILSKSAQTSVFAGLATNQSGVRGWRLAAQKRVECWQLPLAAEVIHSAHLFEDFSKCNNALVG